MSYPHLNGGYGAATAAGIHALAPSAGKVFLVADGDNANFNDIDNLFSPDSQGEQRRFSTIDAAVGACTANAGDIILVAPGHVETISSATSLVVDVAGVTIIGLGRGSARPKLAFTATASSLELDAAGAHLENLVLEAQISAVVVGVNVDADDITLKNVEFNFESTGDDFVTMIDVDAVSGFQLLDSKLIAEDTAGCAEAIRLDTANYARIEGNFIYGDFTDGAIIGEGAASTGIIIKNNDVYNSDTTAGFVLDMNVASTGILAHNNFGTLFATAPGTALDPGSLLSIENYVCNAVDESGALVPTTVST